VIIAEATRQTGSVMTKRIIIAPRAEYASGIFNANHKSSQISVKQGLMPAHKGNHRTLSMADPGRQTLLYTDQLVPDHPVRPVFKKHCESRKHQFSSLCKYRGHYSADENRPLALSSQDYPIFQNNFCKETS
jgi:hypothetical protein